MSLISKTTVLGELQTRLSELGANTSSEDLILFLKSAQNGSVDASGVVTELTTRIGAVDTSDTLKELVVLASSLSLITSDRIVSVTSTTDLDNFTDALPGTVVLVTDNNKPYIRKSDDSWVLIDPLLQPNLNPQPNLYAWGFGNNGRLGDNTTVNKSSPVSVVGGYTDWTQVSGGNDHSLGVRADGTAWAWGEAGLGQLGNNSLTDRSSPVQVAGGFTDWVQVSAGQQDHSLGVRADGTAWGWGYGGWGRLGHNSTASARSPVSVVGGFTDWVQVSGGQQHSLGVRANGTAWAWGEASAGRLGDNTIVDKSSPVSVVGGFTDWVQVSGGQQHSLGVRANGTAWGWGNNIDGRLGNDSTVDRSSPVSVVGGFTDWIQTDAGGYQSFGVRANGTLWAWGCNDAGQLGDNTTVNKSSPVSVVGGFTDWTQVSVGLRHSLGVRANGTAWAWGRGYVGMIGDNTTTNKSSPVSVIGGFTDWVQVSAGQIHSLGIRGG